MALSGAPLDNGEFSAREKHPFRAREHLPGSLMTNAPTLSLSLSLSLPSLSPDSCVERLYLFRVPGPSLPSIYSPVVVDFDCRSRDDSHLRREARRDRCAADLTSWSSSRPRKNHRWLSQGRWMRNGFRSPADCPRWIVRAEFPGSVSRFADEFADEAQLPADGPHCLLHTHAPRDIVGRLSLTSLRGVARRSFHLPRRGWGTADSKSGAKLLRINERHNCRSANVFPISFSADCRLPGNRGAVVPFSFSVSDNQPTEESEGAAPALTYSV
jgi:hypothetical protein